MICQDFPLIYSAQLDGQADEREQLALQKHLRECADCRRNAAELRSLRSELQALEMPKAPFSRKARIDLTAQIQSALRVEARAYERVKRSRAELIDLWRTRLFSQGIGAVISVAMFVVTFAGVMQPAFRTLALAQALRDVLTGEEVEPPQITDTGIQFRMAIFQPAPPPVFTPSGELLNLGASLSEDDEVIATLKVGKDGRASINEMVSPTDQATATRFSTAIQRASFQPSARPKVTNPEAVVILSKIDIKASISG
ncbi:MAG: anti-sigma factor family protein [Blastocatellia bacterium]